MVFEEFSLKKLLKEAKAVRNFKIEFLEPTYFNTTRGNNVIRLPIPELIFSNLSNLWDEFFDGIVKFQKEEFIKWINKNVFPSSLEIKTKAKEMGESIPAVGIIGWANFKITHSNSNYSKYVDCLGKFGELSNIGGNRTAGLGVIKYTPLEYFEKY
ncbi:hypothetical protein ES705_17558 [subsurface metagenome]